MCFTYTVTWQAPGGLAELTLPLVGQEVKAPDGGSRRVAAARRRETRRTDGRPDGAGEQRALRTLQVLGGELEAVQGKASSPAPAIGTASDGSLSSAELFFF